MILEEERNFLFNVLADNGVKLPGLMMGELGNQIWYNGRAAKDIFSLIGVNHISFDINGQNGALPIDLSKPIPTEFWDRFDVVTDFGCSEHVSNPYEVNRNIHRITKVGGLIVRAVPLEKTWSGHCIFRYRFNAFMKLTDICKYKLLISDTHSKNLLWGAMIKTEDSMFPTYGEFVDLNIINTEKF
jgi:SAM-dependent methyltransferase